MEDPRKKIMKDIDGKIVVGKVNEVIEYTKGLHNKIEEQEQKIIELEKKVIAQVALTNKMSKVEQPAVNKPVEPVVKEPAEAPTTPPPTVNEEKKEVVTENKTETKEVKTE